MGLAMRHGVLFYEAMGLNNRISDLRFGVLFYEVTRSRVLQRNIVSIC